MSETTTRDKVAFLVAGEGIEQVELTEPWQAIRETGLRPTLVATTPGPVQAFEHLDPAEEFLVDQLVDDVDAADFAALVIPGGVANSDQLRTHQSAVDFAREFFELGSPVAAICHAPWTLVEADVLPGRMLTSWPSLKTDIVNAGGQWSDEPVVVCRHGSNTLITSRGPDDLPQFCSALTDELAEAGSQVP